MAEPGALILVVDDDADVRDSVAEVLREEGFAVVVAGDGKQALEVLRSHHSRPNLILLDLMMPVMDGFEFCRQWGRDPGLKDIPVVVLSADAHAERKAMECGANGCLRKPVDLNTLLGTVSRHAGGASSG